MKRIDNETSRMGKSRFMKQIALLFLIGFFIGAAFYYLFQNSFSGLIKSFETQLSAWPDNTYPFSYKMVQALWNHGRYFILFWLLSVTRIHNLYQSAFILYTGFRNGFLVLFFLLGKGGVGILWYLLSLFPHALVFIPLYLFSFAWVKEKGHRREHKKLVILFLGVAFFAACFLEARYNLTLMAKIAL